MTFSFVYLKFKFNQCPVPYLLNLATLHTARAKRTPGGFPREAGATETQLLLQGVDRDRKSRERRENGPASPLQ